MGENEISIWAKFPGKGPREIDDGPDWAAALERAFVKAEAEGAVCVWVRRGSGKVDPPRELTCYEIEAEDKKQT